MRCGEASDDDDDDDIYDDDNGDDDDNDDDDFDDFDDVDADEMMYIWSLKIDDAFINAKSDDFAKLDERTERLTDAATDGQMHWLIGMQWTHPK